MIFFSEPIAAKCSDRSALPKRHPHSGGPQDWFCNQAMEKHILYGLSFDFFVDWSSTSPILTPVVWIKKILSARFEYADVLRHLNTLMLLELGEPYLQRITALKKINDFKVQLIIFRDDFDWNSSESNLLVVTLNGLKKNNFDFSGELVSIQDFKSKIKAFSGGPIRIGSKGLTYGTSNLECHLSKTSSLYPGDVDLILFNKSHRPIAVLEYKKHTLKSPISNQKLSNYYPNPDAKKYNRLAILRDYLNKNSKTRIPILVVYFPTQADAKEGRLELIHGQPEKLISVDAVNFTLPTSHARVEYNRVITELVKAIADDNASG